MANSLVSVKDAEFIPQNGVFPSPRDWRDCPMYFLLVDRFDDNKDHPAYDPATTPTGRDAAQGALFQGGCIKGVTRRLDYIKNLGYTSVWISPILKNRVDKPDSYHGYGIQNFLDVDPRFGTKEDLQELVREAHGRGMYVVLDIILNHTGDNWAYPGDQDYRYWSGAPGPFPFGFWREKNPAPGLQTDDAVWPSEFQNQDWYKRRGSIQDWNDRDQAVNGDFCSLKELEVRRLDALDALIRSYKYWVAAADVDGFRIDTVKHMEDSAVAIFCNAVREFARRVGKDNFFMFGEVVGDDDTIQQYLGRNARIDGTNERFPSLDACLDFPLYFMLEEVIKGFTNPGVLRDRLDWFQTKYADHGTAGRFFVTFVDNHDQMSRPYRRFLNGNRNKDQMVLAAAYLLTAQGVPCLYYGSEQSFDGGGDNDRYVRECMFGGKWGAFNTTGAHFFDESNPVYQGIQAVTAVRAAQPALRYGRQYFREISGDGVNFGGPIDGNATLAWSRVLDTDEVLVAMNLSGSSRNDAITVDRNLTTPGAPMENLLQPGTYYPVQECGGRAFVRVPLPAHGLAVLKKR